MVPKNTTSDDTGSLEPVMIPLSEILAHLSNNSFKLSNTELSELSDLNTDEIKEFEGTWNSIPAERKCQILTRLDELTKNNVELNFDRIYRNAIYCVDDSVRYAAVEGLWESTDPSLLPPLLRLVQRDPSTKVRCAAAVALGRFAMLAEHKKLSDENRAHISQTLLDIIHNTTEPLEVRCRALESVAPMGLPTVTQSIWEAYRSEEQRMHASSIYAMGRNCDQLWLPTLLKEMASEEPEMRYEAATAAGEIGDMAAVAQLIELTADTDAEVKIAAVSALGKIGGKEATQHLHLLLTHKSRAVKDAAEQALSEIESLDVPADRYSHDFDATSAN